MSEEISFARIAELLAGEMESVREAAQEDSVYRPWGIEETVRALNWKINTIAFRLHQALMKLDATPSPLPSPEESISVAPDTSDEPPLETAKAGATGNKPGIERSAVKGDQS